MLEKTKYIIIEQNFISGMLKLYIKQEGPFLATFSNTEKRVENKLKYGA
jgi:hypothetical protein